MYLPIANRLFRHSRFLVCLVFLRTGAFFMGIPLFAGKMIPKRFRLCFALLLAILVNPLVPANIDLAHHFVGAMLLAMNEVCIGLFASYVRSNGLLRR